MFTHTIAGNMIYEKLSPDLYAPVGTDGGDVSSLKWPLGLSFNRPGLQQAGFARQRNIDEFTVATEMAGVGMRLSLDSGDDLCWYWANPT